MGKISPEDSVEVQLIKLKDSWELHKNDQNQEHALFKAVFDAFK